LTAPSSAVNARDHPPRLPNACICGGGPGRGDEDNVTKFAQDHRIPFTTFQDLTQDREVIRLVEGEVDRVNRTLSQVESIKKVALLPRRFYEEEGDVYEA
jgi:long-subunit acyl-CoA synthetase (AMP-forming)